MKILNAPMPGYLLKPRTRLHAHDPSQTYLHALSSAQHQTLSVAVVAGIGATGTAAGLNALWAELNDHGTGSVESYNGEDYRDEFWLFPTHLESLNGLRFQL